MKERIVIEKELLEKIIKASPIQWFDNKEKTDKLVLFGKEYKTEKYPTNWEELKTMCEELEGQTSDVTCDVLKNEIDVTIWNIDRSYKVGFAEFYYDGDKVHLGMGTGFSIPIEIPKVWAFIKSLIGEE